jgi:hypothetical protein
MYLQRNKWKSPVQTNKLLKYFILAVCLIVAVASISSFVNGIVVRSNDDNALSTLISINKAQNEFKNRYGKYGTLNDLINNGLVKSELSDGDDSGFRFIVINKDSSYIAIATPLHQHWSILFSSGTLIYYIDESGNYRFSRNGINFTP